MNKKILLVGAVTIAGYVLADYVEPKIMGWLNLAPTNTIGVKAVKYGTIGGLAMATFWLTEKYVK